jgi:hypothetical protein
MRGEAPKTLRSLFPFIASKPAQTWRGLAAVERRNHSGVALQLIGDWLRAANGDRRRLLNDGGSVPSAKGESDV